MRTRTWTRTLRTLVTMLAVGAWIPLPALAQESGAVGLEVSAGYNFMSGDDLDFLDDGFGFEALGSYAFPSGLELGAGAGISLHDQLAVDRGADIISLLAEGRYRFGVPASEVPHLHPFVAARVGWSQLSLETVGEEDASASGLLFGGGGGVEYWFTDGVGIVGTVLLHFLDYGDSDEIQADISGREIDLRAGLKVRF